MFIAIGSDSSTNTPTTSWDYLAGLTSETTIKGPNGVALSISNDNTYPWHNRQQLIKFDGKIHIACTGKTDSANPTRWQAHVARLETNGSWTLLGGALGIRHSSSGTINRMARAIFVYNSQLYVAFEENNYLRVARWNTSTSSWNVLTTQNATGSSGNGLHHDSTWSDSFNTNPQFFGSKPPTFITLPPTNSLYLVFAEWGNIAGRIGLVGSKFNGTTFNRVAEFEDTHGRPYDYLATHLTVATTSALYIFHRNPPNASFVTPGTWLYRFTDSGFALANSDTGVNGSLFLGRNGTNGLSRNFYNDGDNLRSISEMVPGDSGYVPGFIERLSTDQGASFSTINVVNSWPSNILGSWNGFQEDAITKLQTIYLSAIHPQSSPSFQPYGAYALSYGPIDTPDPVSWEARGAGMCNTSNQKNVTKSRLYIIDNEAYVLYEQESVFPITSYSGTPDNKIYLAKTTL